MKKIIFIIFVFITLFFFSSCGETYTLLPKGNITIMDYNGNIIRSYKEAAVYMQKNAEPEHVNTLSYDGVIEIKRNFYNPISKDNAISFVDEFGESHYISGGIIIIDDISHRMSVVPKKPDDKDKLIDMYFMYEKIKKENVEKLKNSNGIPKHEIKSIKYNIENIKKKMEDIENILWLNYHYAIQK